MESNKKNGDATHCMKIVHAKLVGSGMVTGNVPTFFDGVVLVEEDRKEGLLKKKKVDDRTMEFPRPFGNRKGQWLNKCDQLLMR